MAVITTPTADAGKSRRVLALMEGAAREGMTALAMSSLAPHDTDRGPK